QAFPAALPAGQSMEPVPPKLAVPHASSASHAPKPSQPRHLRGTSQLFFGLDDLPVELTGHVGGEAPPSAARLSSPPPQPSHGRVLQSGELPFDLGQPLR